MTASCSSISTSQLSFPPTTPTINIIGPDMPRVSTKRCIIKVTGRSDYIMSCTGSGAAGYVNAPLQERSNVEIEVLDTSKNDAFVQSFCKELGTQLPLIKPILKEIDRGRYTWSGAAIGATILAIAAAIGVGILTGGTASAPVFIIVCKVVGGAVAGGVAGAVAGGAVGYMVKDKDLKITFDFSNPNNARLAMDFTDAVRA